MNITGGKGRFEGATGYFEAEGYGYPGFSSDITLVGEEGTITGEIFLRWLMIRIIKRFQ